MHEDDSAKQAVTGQVLGSTNPVMPERGLPDGLTATRQSLQQVLEERVVDLEKQVTETREALDILRKNPDYERLQGIIGRLSPPPFWR